VISKKYQAYCGSIRWHFILSDWQVKYITTKVNNYLPNIFYFKLNSLKNGEYF